ncbi:MAG: hypothetical protein H0T39_10980 [Actinobacteria bacterium]|nr:hypothetical protein [Actinomycetota bacterium]
MPETVDARLASGNPHKLEELRAALPGWRIELLEADELPPETGETYYANALDKARFGRTLAEPAAWVLGEDSGLEVAGLGGRPGIESARYAGPAEDPVEKLLAELEGVEGEGRRARYVCELVCLSPALEELHGSGTLEGAIAEARSGAEGFGYDPVFVPDGEARTVAELGDAWKREHSHRAAAARALGRHPDPPLSVLFGAYFHQDWIINGPDAAAVISLYVDDATKEEVLGAIEEVEALLGSGLSERRLARTVRDMGLNYLPQADGMTHREWLGFVIETLEARLREKG